MIYLRAEPPDPAGARWLSGARQQAALAGLELLHDETSIDGPTLINALQAAAHDAATNGVILEGDSIGGVAGLQSALAKAAAAGIPVVAQSSAPSLDVTGTILVDDEQLMREVLESVQLSNGSEVGFVAPARGYARLDRRGDAWTAIREERGWVQILMSEETAASLSTVPDDGASARIVSAALQPYPHVALVGAPNAFLLAAAGDALRPRENLGATDLVGVVDASESDVDLAALWEAKAVRTTVGIVDPVKLGAVSVRAIALLIADEVGKGLSARVSGQVLNVDDLRRVSARRVADIFSVLDGHGPGSEGAQLTTPWLPALDAT